MPKVFQNNAKVVYSEEILRRLYGYLKVMDGYLPKELKFSAGPTFYNDLEGYLAQDYFDEKALHSTLDTGMSEMYSWLERVQKSEFATGNPFIAAMAGSTLGFLDTMAMGSDVLQWLDLVDPGRDLVRKGVEGLIPPQGEQEAAEKLQELNRSKWPGILEADRALERAVAETRFLTTTDIEASENIETQASTRLAGLKDLQISAGRERDPEVLVDAGAGRIPGAELELYRMLKEYKVVLNEYTRTDDCIDKIDISAYSAIQELRETLGQMDIAFTQVSDLKNPVEKAGKVAEYYSDVVTKIKNVREKMEGAPAAADEGVQQYRDAVRNMGMPMEGLPAPGDARLEMLTTRRDLATERYHALEESLNAPVTLSDFNRNVGITRIGDLSRMEEQMAEAQRGVWFGSSGFDQIQEKLHFFAENFRKLPEMCGAGIHSEDGLNYEDIGLMRTQLSELRDAVAEYKGKKEGKSLNANGKKRMEAVERIESGISVFEETLTDLETALDMAHMDEEVRENEMRTDWDATFAGYDQEMKEHLEKYLETSEYMKKLGGQLELTDTQKENLQEISRLAKTAMKRLMFNDYPQAAEGERAPEEPGYQEDVKILGVYAAVKAQITTIHSQMEDGNAEKGRKGMDVLAESLNHPDFIEKSKGYVAGSVFVQELLSSEMIPASKRVEDLLTDIRRGYIVHEHMVEQRLQENKLQAGGESPVKEAPARAKEGENIQMQQGYQSMVP